MSIDEILRTIMYVLLIPGLAYLGVRVWNAVVMPEVLRRPIAVMYRHCRPQGRQARLV